MVESDGQHRLFWFLIYTQFRLTGCVEVQVLDEQD